MKCSYPHRTVVQCVFSPFVHQCPLKPSSSQSIVCPVFMSSVQTCMNLLRWPVCGSSLQTAPVVEDEQYYNIQIIDTQKQPELHVHVRLRRFILSGESQPTLTFRPIGQVTPVFSPKTPSATTEGPPATEQPRSGPVHPAAQSCCRSLAPQVDCCLCRGNGCVAMCRKAEEHVKPTGELGSSYLHICAKCPLAFLFVVLLAKHFNTLL